MQAANGHRLRPRRHRVPEETVELLVQLPRAPCEREDPSGQRRCRPVHNDRSEGQQHQRPLLARPRVGEGAAARPGGDAASLPVEAEPAERGFGVPRQVARRAAGDRTPAEDGRRL